MIDEIRRAATLTIRCAPVLLTSRCPQEYKGNTRLLAEIVEGDHVEVIWVHHLKPRCLLPTTSLTGAQEKWK